MSAVGDARKRRQEEGRRLASERDDLIAQGVDPAELLIPLGPDDLTAPQPDGPASITFGMDDEQIVFRYQAALDEYDELALWDAFGPGKPYRWPRHAGVALGIPHKRVAHLCERWARQGRYDWGTVVDLGWKERP